jgi:hypothetical protein
MFLVSAAGMRVAIYANTGATIGAATGAMQGRQAISKFIYTQEICFYFFGES